MALVLEQKKEAGKKETKSMALLDEYLKDAVAVTNSDSIIKANLWLSDFSKRPRWEEIDQKDIDARYKENKEKLKEFSFKDRAAYYANLKSKDGGKETLIKLGIVMATAVAASAISPEMGQIVAGIGGAYFGSKMVAGTIGEPKTPTQLFSTRDYTDLKHEQIALRKLSHHLFAKETKEIQAEAIKRGILINNQFGR